MHFASDNTGPVHPRIMDALATANARYAAPYGADETTPALRDKVRDLFEAPHAEVVLVTTGSAANSLLLSSLVRPYQTVFCSPLAHIHTDECGAPEFFTGGAKLTLVPGDGDKIAAQALAHSVAELDIGDVHFIQPGAVSITQATERGTVYTLDEIGAVAEVARRHRLPLHMDGARFANALASLGCTPAEMTWKAGVDAVSFGGTKNGCMGVEAAILFEPGRIWELELRRKRSAHLLSKHRFLAAQIMAYLDEDLWLDLAHSANAACARLAGGLRETPGVDIRFDPDANMIFADMPREMHQRLKAGGADYALYSGTLDGDDPGEPLLARFVCDWSASDHNTDRFLALARG